MNRNIDEFCVVENTKKQKEKSKRKSSKKKIFLFTLVNDEGMFYGPNLRGCGFDWKTPDYLNASIKKEQMESACLEIQKNKPELKGKVFVKKLKLSWSE